MHKQYSEVKRLEVIRDYSIIGCYRQVAKLHKMGHNTVRLIIIESKDDKLIQALIAQQKRDIINKIWEKVDLAIMALTPEKIKNGALNQLVPVIGMLIEKGLLLQGDPTSIIKDTSTMSKEDLQKEIHRLLQKRQERMPINFDNLKILSENKN